MALYRYRGAAQNGEIQTGALEGVSVSDALQRIRRLGLTPLEATPAPAVAPAKLKVDSKTRQGLANTLGELGILLGAGLPLDRAMGVCVDNATRPALKAALAAAHTRVKEGAPLSRAMQAGAPVFPTIASAMAEAGEANGQLAGALNRLAEMLDRAEALRKTIVAAMIYPALLLVLATGVIGLMLLFVVPQFESLFSDQGSRLPFATQVVMAASHGLRNYGLMGLLAMAGLVLLARQQLGRPAVRVGFDRFVLGVPSVGDLVRNAETARFSRVLGSLVDGGVTLPTALTIAERSISNTHMASAVAGVATGLKRGGGLSGPLAATGVLPTTALSFVRTGEETAQLGLMLTRLADLLDREVRTALEAFVAVLTPTITIVMGAIVGGVIASVMSAILGFNDLALPT